MAVTNGVKDMRWQGGPLNSVGGGRQVSSARIQGRMEVREKYLVCDCMVHTNPKGQSQLTVETPHPRVYAKHLFIQNSQVWNRPK
jgi:hypothetical protein